MKKFNTTGVCIPSKHYMVDLSERVKEIRVLVDAGEYFAINRARQYGKTTTINALEKSLIQDYCVLSLDFQGISDAGFKSAGDEQSADSALGVNKTYAHRLTRQLAKARKEGDLPVWLLI